MRTYKIGQNDNLGKQKSVYLLSKKHIGSNRRQDGDCFSVSGVKLPPNLIRGTTVGIWKGFVGKADPVIITTGFETMVD